MNSTSNLNPSLFSLSVASIILKSFLCCSKCLHMLVKYILSLSNLKSSIFSFDFSIILSPSIMLFTTYISLSRLISLINTSFAFSDTQIIFLNFSYLHFFNLFFNVFSSTPSSKLQCMYTILFSLLNLVNDVNIGC